MTYQLIEATEYQRSPVELFTFTRGSFHWRFTSADEDKIVNSFTYTSVPVYSGSFESSQEINRSNLTINIDKTLSFVTQFIASPPTDPIEITIQDYHEEDSDQEVIVKWMGRLINVEFLDAPEAKLHCESLYTAFKRPVLRRKYQLNCPYVLYGAGCLVNRESFRVNATLSGISGLTIASPTFDTFADGWFDGGEIEIVTVQGIWRRFIESHVGDTLTLDLPFGSIAAVGIAVSAFPGCDRSISICEGKFANSIRYGGQPYYPGRNPMGGQSVFS